MVVLDLKGAEFMTDEMHRAFKMWHARHGDHANVSDEAAGFDAGWQAAILAAKHQALLLVPDGDSTKVRDQSPGEIRRALDTLLPQGEPVGN